MPHQIRFVKVGGNWWDSNRPKVQAVHKPTGQSVTVVSDERGNDRAALQKKAAFASLVLKSYLNHKPVTDIVRRYDLTPGMERIRGAGIDTTDVASILDRGELPHYKIQG